MMMLLLLPLLFCHDVISFRQKRQSLQLPSSYVYVRPLPNSQQNHHQQSSQLHAGGSVVSNQPPQNFLSNNPQQHLANQYRPPLIPYAPQPIGGVQYSVNTNSQDQPQFQESNPTPVQSQVRQFPQYQPPLNVPPPQPVQQPSVQQLLQQQFPQQQLTVEQTLAQLLQRLQQQQQQQNQQSSFSQNAPQQAHHHQQRPVLTQNVVQPSQQQEQSSLPQGISQPSQQQQQQNQHVIYVGGQQIPYKQPQSQISSQPNVQHNGAQGVSFSTSYSGDVIRQGKVVGSVQPPAQAIQKAPASEIEFDKGGSAKDKATPNDDEYVVYYYYYYDDDPAGKNLTLNFDDIPNLEQYDQSKAPKLDKGPSARSGAVPSNSILSSSTGSDQTQARSVPNTPSNQIPSFDTSAGTSKSPSAVSVSVSVSDGLGSSPISNVFRYGSGDIPRVPVTPNVIEPQISIRQSVSGIPIGNAVPIDSKLTTPQSSTSSVSLEIPSPNDNDILKATEEANVIETETQTEAKVEETTVFEPTTTTEEPTTTTEPPTTTTERGRRRLNNRRRFGGQPPRSGTTPTRRPIPRSSTTTTTTSSTSTARRGSIPSRFNSNRVRRPSFTSNRVRSSRPGVRDDEDGQDESVGTTTTSTTTASTSTSSTTTGARRFGASRRNGSTRSGFSTPRPTSSSFRQSVSTTRRPAVVSRTRPTTARSISLNNINRDRTRSRSRAPFFRPRNQQEEEPVKEEEVTTLSPSPETSPSSEVPTSPEPSTEAPNEEEYEDAEPTEAPTTTTERNRAIFRPRSRPALFAGNRPRPSPLNRSRPR